MKDIGLSQQELALIVSVFRGHPKIEKVLIFGSRAKGTAKPSSDIDLAVEGIRDNLHVEALTLELEELPLPYTFDVLSIHDIINASLLDHIARVGIIIYEKNTP